MERRGLATHTADQPRRFIPAPPRLAVSFLISRREVELQDARSAIPWLENESSDGSDPADGDALVELVTDRDHLEQLVAHVRGMAKEELLGLHRLPFTATDQSEPRPGLRVRSISDVDYLKAPGALDALRTVVGLGERARLVSVLPIKMVVADRRIGLLMNADELKGPALVVRPSPLLDTLCALFELIWERGTPVDLTQTDDLQPMNVRRDRYPEASRRLVPMLAAGYNDKAIAHHEGISMATMNRRVAELAKLYGTRTRFQLGWRLAMETTTGHRSANPSTPA